MSDQRLKISFIGYGNIAKAIAEGLVSNPRYHLSAASPSLQPGFAANGLVTDSSNIKIVADADIVFLAVKPVNMQDMLLEIKPFLPKSALIISVAAGLSLTWLEKFTPKHQAIVRCMPNIAISVKKGATPLIANSFVSAEQREIATALFECSGLITWVNDENDIDVFNALSGSGPAYVFLFLEALAKGAENLGLSQALAQTFAQQTMEGAIALAKESQLEVKELRKKVTSAGGTTAAALAVFQEQGFESTVAKAIEAAYKRARELGSG